MERERFASRLGFLLMTAGCAIGLGNVWRFPYIAGQFGGSVFVLIYLLSLALIGFPVMVAELSLGRAAQSDLPGGLKKLAPPESKIPWRGFGYAAFAGNFVLLMFYAVVTGWMMSYFWQYLTEGVSAECDVVLHFKDFLGDWKRMLVFNLAGILFAMVICMIGVRKGIERAMKVMLGGMFALELILICIVLTYDHAWDGVRFFLAPDCARLRQAGIWSAIYAAMMHSFFTLSLGIGSVAICGSYIGKDRSIPGEAVLIIILDTTAAIAAGLIIFPACFALNVQPDQGPPLVFITLTKVFQSMSGGRWIGLLFFLFMSVAALSTLIAVGENIIACFMRVLGLTRCKSSLLFGGVMSLLSLPCLFGFNLLSSAHPFGGDSTLLDLEDFIVSDNILPLGAAVILFFCTRDSGWGFGNFLTEANTGKGLKILRRKLPRFYMKWFLPFLILAMWVCNLTVKFFIQ